MGMIWHDHRSMQVELVAVFLQTALKDNVSQQEVSSGGL